MTFDLDTAKRLSAKVDVGDIDLAGAFADAPLGPAALRCLRYMHDVELHTTCYLRNLLNTRAHHDPDITAFMTLWAYEELWHGEVIAAVLAAHGEPAGAARVAPMRRRLGWRLSASPLAWMAFSAATPNFLALHMTVGAINEWTTQAGYGRLSATAGHPVLAEVLRRVMRQEGRHIDMYLTKARDLLGSSARARSTTRRLLRWAWQPVGAQVMAPAETRHLVQTLFSGDAGAAVVARIDRRIDALPGLDGLGLVSGAVARLGASGAAARGGERQSLARTEPARSSSLKGPMAVPVSA